MVAESSGKAEINHFETLDEDQLKRVRYWLKPIKQALSLEAECGFNNLQGRQEAFSTFITREFLHESHPSFKYDTDAEIS